MDREGLKNAAPPAATMNAELPYRRKLLAERYIEDVLAAIAGDKREPDGWEAVHLCAAIGAINSHVPCGRGLHRQINRASRASCRGMDAN